MHLVTLRSEDAHEDERDQQMYYNNANKNNNNNGATSSQLTFAQLKDQMQLAKTVDLAKLLLNNKWNTYTYIWGDTESLISGNTASLIIQDCICLNLQNLYIWFF